MSTLKKSSKNEKMEHSALKTEFRPASKTQAVKLSKSFGVSRFAYNSAVTKASEMLSQKEQYPNFQALRNDMNSRKAKEFPWMFEVPKDIPAEAARDAETALKNFFESRSGKRKGKKLLFPRKKKKGKSKDSFRLPSEVVVVKESVDDKVVRVKLGKLGIIKLLEPISLKTWRVTSATVSRRAGRYFISFSVRRPEKSRIRNVTKPLSIGLDLGIKNLVTYSNGAQKEGPKSLKKKEKKLKRLSRRLSNKHVPGKLRSRNAIKAAEKMASLHMKITNIRKDFREKETTRLARSYDLVCVESLNVQGMVKNHCLAKSISDQSFGAFVAALERKQETFGMGVLKVGTFFPSSKQCRKCGVKNHNLMLSDRVFNCASTSCGHVEDRDVHAAVNIQHEAISNFKNYSAATEEITPGEILALPETSNKGSGNRDRGTRKGTKVARQERPNIKYNERQKSFQIKALIRQ